MSWLGERSIQFHHVYDRIPRLHSLWRPPARPRAQTLSRSFSSITSAGAPDAAAGTRNTRSVIEYENIIYPVRYSFTWTLVTGIAYTQLRDLTLAIGGHWRESNSCRGLPAGPRARAGATRDGPATASSIVHRPAAGCGSLGSRLALAAHFRDFNL